MKNFLISLRLTIVFIVICSVLYPIAIALVAKLAPGGGHGVQVHAGNKVVGYELIGQKFTDDRYFWGRPSATNYNGSGSAGSNKGPSNPDYLKQVQDRIDTFLAHHRGIRRAEVPAELVTASGSGIDPDISPAAAYVQVERVAQMRHMDKNAVRKLVDEQVQHAWLGPDKVNVLKLNLALDKK